MLMRRDLDHVLLKRSLFFNKETKGLPKDILHLYRDRCYTLPMQNPNIRSLNLAMTAGIVLYEAIRQCSTK